MNNFVDQRRSAATATVAAFFFVGQATQAQASTPDREPGPIVRFQYSDGSPGMVSTISASTHAEQSADFAAAVGAAFEALAKRQQRLDPEMARAMTENAWDLYEEA